MVGGVGAPGVAARFGGTDVIQQACEDRVGCAQVRDGLPAGRARSLCGYGCPSAPPGTPELVE